MELEIVTIPADTALSVFTTDGAINPYLHRARQAIDGFTSDVGTRSGRKEIASFAARIAKYKTALEDAGKTLADEQKLIPKKIDATRKLIRDTLDQWRDEVRRPLTDWEEAEETRIANHEAAVAGVAAMAQFTDGRSSAELLACLEAVEAAEVGPHCEEYEDAYRRAKAGAIAALRPAIAAREKYEAEQAELDLLRKQAAERAARDREDAIRREAADKARLDAERAAKAEADRIEAQAIADRAAAEQREAELKAYAAAAEQRAAETEARLKREAYEKAAAERAEIARREADTKHRAAFNRQALDAFVAGGLPEGHAKTAIKLIAQRAIPNIAISY